MLISFIIPVLNEQHGIAQAIELAWEAGAHEVIVVDGGSTDATAEICRRARCTFLQSQPGRAAQQNAGAAAANGSMLLFLHADNHLAAGAAQQVAQAVTEGAQCGAFRQQIDAPGRLYRYLEWGNARRVLWWGLPYGDQAIFLTRELFESAGQFPEVRLMEDLLLMRRVRRTAFPVLLPGPLHVNARRWQQHGVIRQTARNWLLLLAWRCGISTDRLARFYRRHDK